MIEPVETAARDLAAADRLAAANQQAVEKLIRRGRSEIRPETPRGVSSRGPWLCAALTGLCLWACFTPLDWAPLAWVALVPVLMLVRTPLAPRWLFTAVGLFSFASQVAQLQWMRLGDPTMYIAWVALATYLSLYLPLFVSVTRALTLRLSVPLVVVAPLVWVAGEYAKGHLMTGFGWYLLGHSQYRWLEMIQISDVTGVYGVSFVMVASAAALTLLVPNRVYEWFGLVPPAPAAASWRKPALSVAVAGVLFGAVLGYGYVRRGQADFKPGPRVALIQGNFPASLREPSDSPAAIFTLHMRLTGMSVREQPDLIVWPEGMFPYQLLEAPADVSDETLARDRPEFTLDRWRDTSIQKLLADESRKANAALILGTTVGTPGPERVEWHNSATFIRPDVGVAGRYDKIHLVPFGEYIPLTGVAPWLQSFTPYRGEIGLKRGTTASVFEYRGWRVSPVICYEDTVPHLVRGIVSSASGAERGKEVDVLVNISNDGWFHGSSELDQHLITGAFRAVECRVPLVRAVNTGISAVIDGDGAILDPEVFIDGDRKGRTSARDPKTGAWLKQINAAVVQTVPLDNRRSLYVAWGDWFAQGCCAAAVFGLAVCGWNRRRDRRNVAV